MYHSECNYFHIFRAANKCGSVLNKTDNFFLYKPNFFYTILARKLEKREFVNKWKCERKREGEKHGMS